MKKKETTQIADEFRIDIGRADKGRTFVRVTHLPSGKKRTVIGTEQENPHAVAKRLTEEIRHELELGVDEDPPVFDVGDSVEVHEKILEGEKERTKVFVGLVISRKGEGMREMFTVRRIVQGEGIERTFRINSPKIAKVDVKRSGKVRRAKLYYLRKPKKKNNLIAPSKREV